MKSFAQVAQAALVAVALAAPLASFAQSNQPVTRAQVRAELVQLEQAGYNPSRSSDTTYPADILAAEARVAAQNGGNTGVGGTHSSSSESGARSTSHAQAFDGLKPVYFGQ